MFAKTEVSSTVSLSPESIVSILQSYSQPPWGTGIPTAEQLVGYMLRVYRELVDKGIDVPIVLTERAYDVLQEVLEKAGVEVEPVDDVEYGIIIDYRGEDNEVSVSLRIGDDEFTWGVALLDEFVNAFGKMLKRRKYYAIRLRSSGA